MSDGGTPAPGAGAQHGRPVAAGVVAGLAVVSMLALVAVIAGAPIRTHDYWFHLEAGEAYAMQGLWPERDPMLFTAHADAPVQHEWLFGVAIYALERTLGHHGLRVVHLLCVLAIAGVAWRLARRELVSSALAACVVAIFLATGWWRLVQLRPDLVSIPATFVFAGLLLRCEAMEPALWRRRVAGACLLSLVWANAHSLFALGPALALAALGAAAIDAWLPGASDAERAAARLRARRLAAALAIVLLVTLLNPRGPGQLLTFFTSSSQSAIWAVQDEWRHFDPRSWSSFGFPLSPLAGAITGGTLALLVAASLETTWRFVRCLGGDAAAARRARPDARELQGLALALASAAAVCVSIRFAWLQVFAWIYLVQRIERSGAPAQGIAWGASAAAVALAAAFPAAGYAGLFLPNLASGLPEYLRSATSDDGFYVAGADFLADAGLEGNLFNRSSIGGYLGHRLAPRVRTFIDGRTEHYDRSVLDDYLAIVQQKPTSRGESALEALDRYAVDLYFGVGLPMASESIYTTARLEGEPGWLQIFRTYELSVWLRRSERNAANLARVERYYRERSVPFARETGFDPLEAMRAAPRWAVAAGVVPPGALALRARAGSPVPGERRAAQSWLATLYFLLGGYAAQIGIDAALVAEVPQARFERSRLVHGLLRAGRGEEALAAAAAAAQLDRSARSQMTLALARTLHAGRAPPDGRPLRALLYAARLYSPGDVRRWAAVAASAGAQGP